MLIQAAIDTVVDQKALKVQGYSGLLRAASVDDARCDVRDVEACVTLPSDEKFLRHELGESGVEVLSVT